MFCFLQCLIHIEPRAFVSFADHSWSLGRDQKYIFARAGRQYLLASYNSTYPYNISSHTRIAFPGGQDADRAASSSYAVPASAGVQLQTRISAS